MEKGKICVLAQKKDRNPYRYLSLEGEEIEIYRFDQSLSSINISNAGIVVIDCGYNIDLGLRLLKEVKVSRSELPVIFVADTDSNDVALDALRSGARDYFRKPVNILELQKSIVDLLKFKRASKEKRTAYFSESRPKTREATDTITADKPAKLLRVIKYIEEKIPESICLDDVARESGFSKYYFCKDFKRVFGMTPMKFVTFMRIRRAKELLRRSDLNITDIAFEVGFGDRSTFVRGFRKFAGVSPREYKHSIRME